MGARSLCIIEQGVCRQIELLILQTHVIVEHRLFVICMILTPVRRQHRLTIHQFTAFKEIAEVIHAVIV